MTDSIHTTPLVPHFGPRGMCAALGLTLAELTTAYRTGQIAAPDTVHLHEPRWLPLTLRDELARIYQQAGADPAVAGRVQAERMARATQAEGWQ